VNFDNNIYECITEHISGSEFNNLFWFRLDSKAAPADLQKAMKYLASRQFYESAAGKNLLTVKTESTGGLVSKNIIYREIEIEHIINSYKKPNI
jgi:phosphoglycerol transferase MdoB-like AlkP superfamily enzyme